MRLLIIILLFATNAFGTTYYITPGGSGTGTGLDSANTMSYAALFNKALATNDVVKFKGNNTYIGQHYAKDNVTYDRYSSGTNPILSGFTVLTGWTPHATIPNVYSVALDVPILHGVVIDGSVRAMGRYPNSGFLNYETSTNTSITDNQLAASPNWVGGEVVIRKFRWVWDRQKITSHSAGGTLSYTTDNFYGDNTFYKPVNGNGYFIQGHINTLDQDGEWYYDNPNNRLYIYSSSNPTGRTIKASTVDQVVPLNSSTNITFRNIDFEGGNTAIINNSSSNIQVINCNFRQQGSSAISGTNCSNISVSGGSISESLNTGFLITGGGTNITINGVYFYKNGTVVGMGANSDPSYCGINVAGTGLTFRNNRVVKSGFHGIEFIGSNVLVTQNFVDTFGLVKDDCGGIYSYNDGNATVWNRTVTNNIVLHGIGAQAGTEGDPGLELYGKAAGIYLDDHTNDTRCDSNTVSGMNWGGIVMHNTERDTVRNNLVFDGLHQLLIVQDVGYARNLLITRNNFIARLAAQHTMYILIMNNADSPANFGVFNNNTYARPVDDNITITVHQNYSGGSFNDLTLNSWKSTFSQDAASVKSLVATTDPNNFRFDYNYSASTAAVSLPAIYKSVDNTSYSSLSLSPYSAKALIYNSPFPAVTPSNIEIRFPYKVITAAATTSGTDVGYSASATRAEPSASSYTTPDAPYFIHAYEGSYAGGTGDIIIENKRIAVSSGNCISAYMPISFGRKIYIRNCVFINSGSGNTIHITDDTYVEISNCRFYSTSPAGQAKGRAVYAYKPYNVKINNCYMEQTAGNKIEYWSSTAGGSVDIRYNKVKNIDGRGYGYYCQFIQLQHIVEVPNQKVEWNMVINEPNNSRAEDNVNLGEASGTLASPLSIRNNFIWGAYPDPATASGFTGTGMTTDAGGADVPPISQPHYIIAEQNQFAGCMNSSMNIAAGWNITYQNNRMVTSGKLQDGTSLPSAWGACAIFKGQPSYTTDQFHDNQIINNYINSNTPITYFENEFMPAGNTMNTYAKTATYADEAAELGIFQSKLNSNHISVGVLP